MHKYLVLFLVAILVSVSCKKPSVEQVYAVATSKYVDAFTWVQNGTMPLVITVPHGGTLAPDSIADRLCPNITTAVDTYTIELIKSIDSVAKTDYGFQPYIVLTNLRRIKLDQNRDLPEATCSTPSKYAYWYNFHNSVDAAIDQVLSKYPSCMYVDLHGHGHTKQRLELGYLVSKTQLQNASTVVANNTSIRYLTTLANAPGISQLLTGVNAFGTLLHGNGFPSVPSASDPFPEVADGYFDGGYNTQLYTNRPKVFGVQIETNYTGVRANSSQRALFAKAFLKSVVEYCTSVTNLQPTSFGR